jgi:phosphoketolase
MVNGRRALSGMGSVIVAGKQPELQWVTMDQAVMHCTNATPFDMVRRNDLDRYHLVMDVIDRVPGLADQADHVCQLLTTQRLAALDYAYAHGEDPPEISGWTWPG